jgi:hypothetical protein
MGDPNLNYESEPATKDTPVEDASDDEEDDKNSLLKFQLDIWKTAVHTQMHFNDMSAKARQHGIGLIVVIVGFALFLMSRSNQDYFITIFRLHLHISFFITLIPPVVLVAIRWLDLNVYHKMLRGAVEFGNNYEEVVIRKKIMKTKQGMTQVITAYSRYDDVEKTDNSGIAGLGKYFKGTKEKKARDKLSDVYWIAFACLIALPILLFFLNPTESKTNKELKETTIEKKWQYEEKNSSSGM